MVRNPDFILASASPRRAEILQQIGTFFRVMPANIDESPLPGELPGDYVIRMAIEKATAGWNGQECLEAERPPVLGADTSVVLEGRILGKPVDESDAINILSMLSGNTHSVLSAVAMCRGDICRSLLSETYVTFRSISADECYRYCQTGETADKAGAYGIQGLGAVFVKKIEGSYSGVVGLPIEETCQLLQQFSVSWWRA